MEQTGVIITNHSDIGDRPSYLRDFLTNAHPFAGFRMTQMSDCDGGRRLVTRR